MARRIAIARMLPATPMTTIAPMSTDQSTGNANRRFTAGARCGIVKAINGPMQFENSIDTMNDSSSDRQGVCDDGRPKTSPPPTAAAVSIASSRDTDLRLQNIGCPDSGSFLRQRHLDESLDLHRWRSESPSRG